MADAKIIVSAQDNASRVLSQVSSSLGQVQSVAAQVSSALGLIGVAGVGGLALMAKSAIDGIDALNDLGDATGSSIENISALEDVAARTGTSMDTVSTALIKFNGVLKEAKPGSGTEAALKAIGLNAKELRDLDPAEALLQTATALSLFADDGNKARITQELFGKSLKDVAPFLKDLADKGKLVATVTAEQAREAEKFNKELFQLQKSMADSSREMAGPMVSAINAMIEKFRLGTIAGKSFYRTIVDEQLRLLGFNDGPKEYAARIEEISKKLESGNLHVNQRNALLREQAALQAKLNNTPNFSPDNQSAAEDARLNRKQSIGDIPGKDKDKKSGGKTQEQKDQEEFEKERLRISRKISMEEGDAINARNLAYQKSLEDQAAAHDKYLEGLMREEVAQSNNNRQLREAVEEIGLTTEQVNALHLARLDSNIALEEQNQLTREELGVSADVLNFYQRRLEMMREQRELTASGQIAKADVESKAEKDKASKEYAKGVHDDLKGALSAAFRDTKDPLGAFGDALANVIYTRAATSLAEAMAANVGGSSGVLASVASFFGFANGGVMSSNGAIPMNAYASGGIANSPQLALFGEGRMNEAFVPLPDGKRIPVSLSGGEGGITVNQPIVINAPNASAGVADQIRAMVPSMLVENKRIIEGVIQQAMAKRGGRMAA